MKSENILKVINNFKKVLPLAPLEKNLNMGYTHVHQSDCGTVACHGGWYAVAADYIDKTCSFMTGVDIMAKDLHLDGLMDILNWASDNPEIWGNGRGGLMFNITGKMAFYHPTKRPEGAKTLQDIIDHWTEVYARVKTLELLSEPPVDVLINQAINVKEKQFICITE